MSFQPSPGSFMGVSPSGAPWGLAPDVAPAWDGRQQGGRRSKKILVVDDDDVDRERISRYIKRFKLPVVIVDASSGSSAIEQLISEDIDLVLLDYQLGDMTGSELLAKLKESSSTPVPTIMVTGRGDERTAIEALRLGVVDYLSKNTMTAETLASVLQSTLKSIDIETKLRETRERLHRMSMYDELTGLPNRNLFFDRLHQAVLVAARRNQRFTMLMLDLNLFKEVNDTLGHAAGDQVLAQVGRRMQDAVRRSDTLARIGGDEFACILHDVGNIQDAIVCAEKLYDSVSEPLLLEGRNLQIGAAIGLANFPDHGQDATTLLSNADNAMYSAKRSRRKYVACNEEVAAPSAGKVPVSQYLYQGIRNQELFLEYQPKLSLGSGTIYGVEALVRWDSPKFGRIMPADFIEAAERSSMIEDLTYAVMDMAFAQGARWRQAGNSLSMAVNVSPRMFDDRQFTARVRQYLQRHGLRGQDVVFEVTETAIASSSKGAMEVMAELAAAGIRLSMDDFGSGFTSFQHIRDIGFSELKIDRQFVSNLEEAGKDAAIVRSMISLAQSLGMRTVAEGVETQRQIDLLKGMGCFHVQGYAIARPMRSEVLDAWLDQRSGGQCLTGDDAFPI